MQWTRILSDYLSAQKIIVPNSGHYIWLDDAEVFDQALRQALIRSFNGKGLLSL